MLENIITNLLYLLFACQAGTFEIMTGIMPGDRVIPRGPRDAGIMTCYSRGYTIPQEEE